MQSMQRQFGRMLHKSPGDNAKVAVLLTDYEDVDRVLAKIIDAATSWRDSWISLCSTQLAVVTEYDGLWDPIVGASEGLSKSVAPTPQLQLEQTLRLKEIYTELKADLLEEMKHIEARVAKPASYARKYIGPMRKTIKKRENKRLDYEKVQDKTTKLKRKPGRTSKDEASLAKLEVELARLSEDFHVADAHLRETLPPILTAAFNMIPLLMETIVVLQNRFLAIYYTKLHGYCGDYGFPSPPPPMDEVVTVFSARYEPAKREFESVPCIATGKAVRQSMKLPDDPSLQDRSRVGPPPAPTLAVSSSRHSSSGFTSANGSTEPSRLSRIPSTSTLSSQPSPRLVPISSVGITLAPTDFTTASRLGQQSTSTPALSPPGSGSDCTNHRSPAIVSTTPSIAFVNMTASGGSMAAAKKKPPPPPPKRAISKQIDQFVVAQYTFSGQGTGDLSFRKGDRIKIIQKTDTLDDWWVGELGGMRGNFPANYCRVE